MIEKQLPDTFEIALAEVAQKTGWSLQIYEYHGAEVRELRKWEGNSLRKVKANLNENEKIQLTLQKDAFKNCAKLRKWLYNNIPMFPYTAQIKWREADALDLTLSVAEYEKILLNLTKSDV